MTVLEQIREQRRLARMRLGQDAPEIVSLKSAPEVRLALVPLTEAEYEQALTLAAALDVPENGYGIEARDRTLQAATLFYALRDPSNVMKKVFSTVEELGVELEAADINHLREMYDRMNDDSSPALDGLSDDDLEALKKAFMTIDLSVLSGRPWWHLRNFFLTLTPTQLQASLSGLGSIKSLIGMSESPESTPSAERS